MVIFDYNYSIITSNGVLLPFGLYYLSNSGPSSGYLKFDCLTTTFNATYLSPTTEQLFCFDYFSIL